MECKNNVKAIEVQNGKTGEAHPRSYCSVFQNKKGDFIRDEVRLIYSGVTRRKSAVALLLDNQAGKCVERGEPYNGLLMVMVIVMNLYSTFPIHMCFLQVINRWTSAYTCTGAAGSRYSFISDLAQPMNE